MNKVNSRWQREIGTWSEKDNTYINREVIKLPDKELEVIIEDNIVRFIGGPTGYESYYIKDFLRDSESRRNKEMCICAGTINSWPECYIQYNDVYELINKLTKKKESYDPVLDDLQAFNSYGD